MIGHQLPMNWMGHEIVTLADLWPETPRAMIVGINPAPVSVDVGHYYQGHLGQALFRKLRTAGIIGQSAGYEDDLAFAAGIGFTDVVKRPTGRATDVSSDELAYGREILERKLEEYRVPLVIFAFKKSAIALLGSFPGNGLLRQRIGEAQVFVMPGPYEAGRTSKPTLSRLADIWEEQSAAVPAGAPNKDATGFIETRAKRPASSWANRQESALAITVQASDHANKRLRIPHRLKRAFPQHAGPVEVVIAGQRISAIWNPRLATTRSGTLGLRGFDISRIWSVGEVVPFEERSGIYHFPA